MFAWLRKFFSAMPGTALSSRGPGSGRPKSGSPLRGLTDVFRCSACGSIRQLARMPPRMDLGPYDPPTRQFGASSESLESPPPDIAGPLDLAPCQICGGVMIPADNDEAAFEEIQRAAADSGFALRAYTREELWLVEAGVLGDRVKPLWLAVGASKAEAARELASYMGRCALPDRPQPDLSLIERQGLHVQWGVPEDPEADYAGTVWQGDRLLLEALFYGPPDVVAAQIIERWGTSSSD